MASVPTAVICQNDTNNTEKRLIAKCLELQQKKCVKTSQERYFIHFTDFHYFAWGVRGGGGKIIGFIRFSLDDSYQLSTTRFSWLVVQARIRAGFISKKIWPVRLK